MKIRILLVVLLTYASVATAQELPKTYSGQEAFQAKVDEARSVLQRSPDSVQALNSLGYYLIVLNDEPDEARKALQRAYKLAPKQSTAMLLSILGKTEREKAEWAVRAMSFPAPSFHALSAFERAVSLSPELSALKNDDVQWNRAHRARWAGVLKSYEEHLPAIILTGQPALDRSQSERGWPKSDRKFQVKGERLVATSKSGDVLWDVAIGPAPVKLAPQPPRLFVIDAKRTRVLDQDTGRTLHQWPSAIPLALAEAPEAWNLWENSTSIVGADADLFFLKVPRYLCVFRQKDAKGWAVYFGHSIKAKLSEDHKVLITESDRSWIPKR